MVKCCMIKKIPNGVGNYDCQYVEDGKIKVCCFKSYEDGVCYAFFKWGLSKEIHFLNSVQLFKE